VTRVAPLSRNDIFYRMIAASLMQRFYENFLTKRLREYEKSLKVYAGSRDMKRELCAFACLAFHPDVPPVGAHEAARDGEPQPGAGAAGART
jgi:hypothetical protein